MASACSIRVRGVVQGVGFRPFVYRLARANTLGGWVLNGEEGVEIYLEGAEQGLQAFVREMKTQPPAAASIAEMEVKAVAPLGVHGFTIRESQRRARPSVRISPDLPVCEDCLEELFDPRDPRYGYPYINCTNCGPRYTVVLGLPYDRGNTTMKDWLLDDYCADEFRDAGNRRFHAQPVACPACGPSYYLQPQEKTHSGMESAIHHAAELLSAGKILARRPRRDPSIPPPPPLRSAARSARCSSPRSRRREAGRRRSVRRRAAGRRCRSTRVSSRPPLGDDRGLAPDAGQRAEDDVELRVDRRDRALERAQVLGLDAFQCAAERGEPFGDPPQPSAHLDQRSREHEHDHGREDDAEDDEQGVTHAASPNPSVSAFM